MFSTTAATPDVGTPALGPRQAEGDVGGHVEVHRDARGRIVEVVEGDKTLAVTYDPAGDVVALAGRDGYVHSRLQYDGTHRLIAEEELRRDGTTRLTSRYVYDARGYYVHGDIGDLERRYDATTGLLVETVEAEGQRVVTWRDIPVEKDYVGITANWFAPYIKQLVVAAAGGAETFTAAGLCFFREQFGEGRGGFAGYFAQLF